MVTPFQLEVRQYVKAVVGGLMSALPLLIDALNSDGLSRNEGLAAVLAFVVGFSAVFYAPNLAAKGQRADPDLSEQDPLGADRIDAIADLDAGSRRVRGDEGVGQVTLIVLVVLAVMAVLFIVLPALGA
jgi:hypothetical protein